VLPSPLPSIELRRLIQQVVLGRIQDLDAASTAAFVRGWASALDVVRRTDLTLPGGTAEAASVVEGVVDLIEAARRRALEDDPESSDP